MVFETTVTRDELVANFNQLAKKLRSGFGTVAITENGEPAFVLLSVQEYREMMDELSANNGYTPEEIVQIAAAARAEGEGYTLEELTALLEQHQQELDDRAEQEQRKAA